MPQLPKNKQKPNTKKTFKKNEKRTPDRKIYAPANGQILPLSSVKDPVFAQNMMGEGVAVSVTGDTIVSPVNGTVAMISPTRHAIGLENDFGDQILVHIGLDTALYNGKGFEVLVSEGQRVKPGNPLVRLDRRFLDAQGADLTTPVTVTNQDPGVFRILEGDSASAGKTPLMERR